MAAHPKNTIKATRRTGPPPFSSVSHLSASTLSAPDILVNGQDDALVPPEPLATMTGVTCGLDLSALKVGETPYLPQSSHAADYPASLVDLLDRPPAPCDASSMIEATMTARGRNYPRLSGQQDRLKVMV